jgi:hypothetical protein
MIYPEYKYGQKVILDKSYANSSEVIVMGQTKPNRIFTTVKDPHTDYKWDVMTNRLSPQE